MTRLKSILLSLTEFILIAVVLAYWVSTGNLLNPVAIGLIGLLIFQIIKPKHELGIIISILFFLMGFFMLLALLSELSEFPAFTVDAGKLLFGGLLFFIPLMTFSGLMFYKYSR